MKVKDGIGKRNQLKASQPVRDNISEDLDETEEIGPSEDPTVTPNDNEKEGYVEDSDYEEETSTLPPRTRKPPGWVRDFVIGLEENDNEQLQNLAMFSTDDDPNCYEDAVKSAVWRQVMD
jgi:hypothetical protein